MKYEKLSLIANYVNEKIALNEISLTQYISTDNMLPNKGGITTAANLPKVNKTQSFRKDDILISNIRPHFKKIWKASFNGGCSNDVIVIRALPEYDSTFLYYALSTDAFFSFASQTAKGTKMPRGDKQAIMSYKIPIFNRREQEAIAHILLTIDEKIRLNSQINDNLQQQVQTVFRERFEGIPFEDLPSGWRVVPLGEVAAISNKSFNPLKESERMLEHYSIPAFDEARFPVFESSTSIKSNKFVIDASCFMISKLNPTTKRVWKPYCLTENAVCSTEFIVYKAKNESITDFLYSVIDSASFSDFMCSHVTGSTGSRQRTTPSDTLRFKLILPSDDELAEYQALVSPMYDQIRINAIENANLKQLQDSLLPKLMSGEIDVSNIQL